MNHMKEAERRIRERNRAARDRGAEAGKKEKIDQKAVREIAGSLECFCQRCHAPLDPAAVVWLDLNCRTNLYSDMPFPEAESQGCFPFGPDCARAVLKAGGECVEIRDQFICGCRIPTRRRTN